MYAHSPARCRSPSRQWGFTLVELLVAMAISGLLLTLVINIYLAQKGSYRYSEGLARIQENSRFAITLLSRRMRLAGYLGCAGGDLSQVTNKLNDNTDPPWSFTVGVEGYEAVGTGPGDMYALVDANPAPSGNGGEWSGPGGLPLPDPYLTAPAVVIPGSDVVIVRGLDETGVTVPGRTNAGQLFACYQGTGACEGDGTSYQGICEEDILLISDCRRATIFQATNLQAVGGGGDCPAGRERLNVVHAVAAGSSDPGNQPPAWQDQFDDNAELLKLGTTAYFVGQGEGGSPALFQKRLNRPPEEIVEGVENLQVLYGEDTDGDRIPNRYLPADQVTAMTGVTALRISLLMRSADGAVSKPDERTHDLAGTLIDPVNDQRLRRVITFTVMLRNRG